MDHAEARELLELAAVEPDGLDRLMAGDTADAAALAGHLAGCRACADEMTRLRAAAVVIREVVRTTPRAELRERTLAFVRELGRDRRATMAATAGGPAISGELRPTAIDDTRLHRGAVPAVRLGWVAAIAAALVVAVVGTAVVVQAQNEATLKAQTAVVNGLSRVATWYLDVGAAADVRRVELVSPTGGAARGSVELSLARQELVVVATGLVEPADGQQLSCWLEYDGERHPIGRMFFGGGLAYWAGDVELPRAIPPGARFGVSTPGAEPVLTGQL